MLLKSQRQIDWSVENAAQSILPRAVHFGKGAQPIQVALAEANQAPSRASLRTLFQDRKGRLPIFVIVAVSHGDSVSVYGPDPDSETIVLKRATAQAVLNSILEQENEISAYQRAVFLWRSKQTTDMVGFTNNGLFASHFIRTSIDRHARWSEAQKRSVELQNLRDKELITGLGFEISASPSSTLLLSANGQEKRVVAIFLDRSENFEAKSTRLQASPVEWSLGIAAQQGAPWVIAIKDSQLRLYPAKDGVGVGQKSQAETYFEIDLLTVDEEKVGLLDLIFSAEALAEGGTAEGLLSDSKKFAAELGVRLRERVYEQVVPPLATEIANQLRTKGHELDSKGLQLSYELTLRVLFRLLFQAYAEDRGLLPAGRNEIFDSNSMKHWAEHLLNRDPSIPFGDSSTIWFDLMQVWDAIDQGNPEMQIPAYNGGLFGSDPDLHPTGSLIRTLSIPDRVMGPALRALVVDDLTEDGVPGAVDFRSLSVREFGTIYEGLLESSLSVADQNLTVDSKGAWVPAKEKDQILAKENEVYFHSASGERKATGSYYTPSFIVDHLIERSVEPALNDHLAKVKELIDAGDQAAAYKLFFDFRVADLAMGSAHFLVAAIDKIESIMRSFLVQPGNSIEGVNAELIRLEEAAKNALGKDEAAYAEIERASLLRRQIARRCIYGLDINPLAVELSRLAIWIHTFVPGLPMSSLEHNLVCANSLTGIGSVDEGLNALIPERAKGQSTLFDGIVEQSLLEAKALLEEVASADEADKQQALKAAEVAKQAREAAAKSKMIFDLAVANRNGIISSGAALDESDLADLHSNLKVKQLVANLLPAHLPYLFPEVMLRENSGFDVLIGNPPWEKVTVEEHQWFGLRHPGIRSLSQKARGLAIEQLCEQNPGLKEQYLEERERTSLFREVLMSGPFPGLGRKAHPDLYQAFQWRNWQVIRNGGYFSLVLPRASFTGTGSIEWRRQLFQNGTLSNVTIGVNSGGWMFEGVHKQFQVALASIRKSPSAESWIAGPVRSINELRASKPTSVEIASLKDWNTGGSLPSLVGAPTLALMEKLYKKPRFGSKESNFGLKPIQELNASSDKKLFFEEQTENSVPIFGGSSINVLDVAFGAPFAFAHLDELERHYASKRGLRSSQDVQLESSSHASILANWRIAFRDITNSLDSKTVVATILPPNVGAIHSLPTLGGASSPRLQAYVLGLMASLVFDWIARRWVGLHLTFEILNSLPVPPFDDGHPHQKRVIELVGQLIEPSDVVGEWVMKLGVASPGTNAKETMLSELNALIANLYGLTREEYKFVLNTHREGRLSDFDPDSSLEYFEEFSR